MAKRTLTERMLKALKPAKAGRRYDIMDAIVPGFGIRVTDKGKRTFILIARFGAYKNPTRRAIGEYGAINLEAARNKARCWLEIIKAGTDPKLREASERREQLRRQSNSFEAVAEEFIRRAVARTRKAREVERDIRRELITRWGARPITEISRFDVLEIVDAAVDRGAPYQAHNLLGYIRRLFNWAISRGTYGIEHSPTDRMKPRDVIGRKSIRERILNDGEMRALWLATETMGYPYGPLFRVLLMTGQRKSEVANARWREFDFMKKLWIIPSERMKSGTAHVVPLSGSALEILQSLPRFNGGDYVFSTTFGAKPVNGFSKAKIKLDELMEDGLRHAGVANASLPLFVIHDIRRSVRTALSGFPEIPDIVRELVIGHARPGLHKVYDQYDYLDEKRHALDLWIGKLRIIVGIDRPAVIPLRRAVV